MTMVKTPHPKNPTRGAPGVLADPGDDGDMGASSRLPEVAYVVLGHVSRELGGIHGYSLGRLLSRSSFRVPSLRLGQLYRILRRLERAGFVKSSVESDSSRLRYRFTITACGEGALREWLSCLPEESGFTCRELLSRLRFADRMPATMVARLIDDALRQCARDLHVLGERPRNGADPTLYETAFRARLSSDRCWLEEVRRLAERAAAGSLKASASG
jgi:DNA-binding PadR family transcriptional regulator